MHRTSRREELRLTRVLWWTWTSILSCGLITIAGCTSLTGRLTSSEATETEPRRSRPIELTYRTDSGRLNLLALGQPETHQVSFRPSASTPVPAFTASTLVIKHPHPAGLHGYSQVTVEFRPRTAESESSSFWKTMTGHQVEARPASPAFGEVWQMDIPDWQLASLLSHLKERHFFRRTKVLGHESDIETAIDGKRFAKEFPAIPELDAMIVNIRKEGWRVDSADMPTSPANLPSVAMRPTPTYSPHVVAQQSVPYPLLRLPEVVGNWP